jgi:uncharacterized membrane protein YfhO
LTGAGILFHHYYFPGWKVYVDGKETPISYENDFGLMLFAVPPGEHRVLVMFGHTPPRFWGEFLSGMTVLIIFGLWVFVLIRRKHDASA